MRFASRSCSFLRYSNTWTRSCSPSALETPRGFFKEHSAAARVFAAQVWLGVTAVNQEEADRDIPKLLRLPARIRFVSMEPLLGPVRLRGPISCALDWVIAGGESGPRARHMDPAWVRSLRDECARAGTPFFFKQCGNLNPLTGQVGKAAAGRLLDGVIHDGVPGAMLPFSTRQA